MENYHFDAAGQDESPDADPFYTWGALCALLPSLEAADFSPWGGLVFAPGQGTGEVVAPGRRWRTEGSVAGVRVLLNDAPLLEARGAQRVWLDATEYRLSVRADTAASIVIEGVNIVHCTVDDNPVHVDAGDAVPVQHGSQLVLWLREPLTSGAST